MGLLWVRFRFEPPFLRNSLSFWPQRDAFKYRRFRNPRFLGVAVKRRCPAENAAGEPFVRGNFFNQPVFGEYRPKEWTRRPDQP
ncbi:MAG: hypothetical protein CM15mP120_11320 [Pseudomonadota bacterium]|nr:MAG: hypothetical protein CM15mP120_11320 [Pseudomonadota bacterium]